MQDLPPELQDVIYKYYYSFDKFKINKFFKTAIRSDYNGYMFCTDDTTIGFYIANTFSGNSNIHIRYNHTTNYKFIENIVLSDRKTNNHL